ncbi:hypothetical protein DL93DRAFT_1163771 [Clavulina sp. PMI_390]|nr:hypothetical protein DL93DRAFT_1163771 [Clavulina sp. PMI_390]
MGKDIRRVVFERYWGNGRHEYEPLSSYGGNATDGKSDQKSLAAHRRLSQRVADLFLPPASLPPTAANLRSRPGEESSRVLLSPAVLNDRYADPKLMPLPGLFYLRGQSQNIRGQSPSQTRDYDDRPSEPATEIYVQQPTYPTWSSYGEVPPTQHSVPGQAGTTIDIISGDGSGRSVSPSSETDYQGHHWSRSLSTGRTRIHRSRTPSPARTHTYTHEHRSRTRSPHRTHYADQPPPSQTAFNQAPPTVPPEITHIHNYPVGTEADEGGPSENDRPHQQLHKERHRDRSPELEREEPHRHRPRSPAQSPTPSPSRRRSRTPERHRFRTPERQRSRTPERHRSRTPTHLRSRSPPRHRSRTPEHDRQRSRSPTRRHSPERGRDRERVRLYREDPYQYDGERPRDSRSFLDRILGRDPIHARERLREHRAHSREQDPTHDLTSAAGAAGLAEGLLLRLPDH